MHDCKKVRGLLNALAVSAGSRWVSGCGVLLHEMATEDRK